MEYVCLFVCKISENILVKWQYDMENVKKRRGERKMRLQDKLVPYLEYCTYRKELDQKTVKAYRIDLNQYFTFVACEEPDKEKIEEYITE